MGEHNTGGNGAGSSTGAFEPLIIQGGMGVAISDWRLAKSVCVAGEMGVVSGTGIALVTTSRLQLGDPGGHVRRALEHFPHRPTAEALIERFYVEGGIPAGIPFKKPSMWALVPPRGLEAITAAAAFTEVWLAKEGHDGPVGINLLEKIQLPHLATLYGAMLAGVDAVIMGAGIPLQIPGSLDSLARHARTEYRVEVIGALREDDYHIAFEPEAVFPELPAACGPLKRPKFLAIVSSVLLARTFMKRASGYTDGFVVEMPTAGGHNAPPRGKMQLDERGEPIYGARDEVDLAAMAELGRPFWLAGGFGSPEGLESALKVGATGIQVGTLFAYCEESGMEPGLRAEVLSKALRGQAKVRTDPLASPTGYPFKVVDVPGTMAKPDVYAARPRLCDLGYLRSLYRKPDGSVGYRCSSEPIDDYIAKGGTAEDAEGRVCLCNALCATAGYANQRRNGYVEAPVVTSGDALAKLSHFVVPGAEEYRAANVIRWLRTGLQSDAAGAAPSADRVSAGAVTVGG